MELSVVTTLYRSAAHIHEFYRRMSAAAKQITSDYEIIFVNDGSPDHSLDLVLTFLNSDPHIKLVDLSRNFGHHKAIMTGLSYCQGNYVFLIDSDMEEKPELLSQLWGTMLQEQDADVIYGVQEDRKGGWFEKWSGRLFYRIFNNLSKDKIVESSAMSRLMTKRYVDALILHQEREIFLPGLWTITGFTQKPITVQKYSLSPSTYTLAKKISLMINAITSFSNKPLIYIFYIGTTISLLSIAYSLYLIIRHFFWDIAIQGWSSLIVSIWLLGGITIFSIGVVGIYISKIFMEVKQRPYSVVKQLYVNRSQEEKE